MTQSRLLERLRHTKCGTFAMHAETGMLYASPHLFNDAAYNLKIHTFDQSRGIDGWVALDSTGVQECVELFQDCPGSPGEFVVIPR